MTVLKKFGVITILAVYLLILVGGIVRSTGSGMGCPDWPKCFGQWVPPTSADELPADYKDVYAAKREKKNFELAKYLNFLGYVELANELLADKSILEEQDFNPTKTWIEYVNRLIGALIGIFIMITAVASFSYRKVDVVIPILGVSSFVLVVFQGWIGAFVVSTNLLHWMVTVHMLLAILLLIALKYMLARAWKNELAQMVVGQLPLSKFNAIALLCLLLSVVQIIMGTQVREQIDQVAIAGFPRNAWIENLNFIFYFHRSFSILVFVLNSYWLHILWEKKSPLFKTFGYGIIGVISIEVISGAVMSYFSVPRLLQPLHLLLALAMFGVQYALVLFANRGKLASAE